MKIYHYADIDSWYSIQKGSWQSKDKPGLGANRRVGQFNEEAYKTSGCFALLEPTPKDWVHNEKFPKIWSILKNNIGKILLEIETDEEKDPNVFIIDRGEMENHFYTDVVNPNEKENRINREIAEGKYIGSKVSLSEYLKNKQNYPYVLPEVIFTENIPLEKISISNEQPLLQELLDTKRGRYRDYILEQIQKIPELKTWYDTKYLTKEKEKPSSEFNKRLK